MKALVVAALLAFAGCSGGGGVYVERYEHPVDHLANVYQTDVLLDDSAMTRLTFYSEWKPNAFWEKDGTGKVRVTLHLRDVRGHEFYIPSDAVAAVRILWFGMDGDSELYDLKRREMQDYYYRGPETW